ncbi:hypothetical protein CSA56_03700 [candidate division KSB3 bacterium]|uniref:beta-lactamase n=1 Tax=candidate division KSB3 bacterium TaxID=2044937 RepID=A0A2G6KIU2_9BACT|nr:MAG: hypothetical protein CSA56_03700 [candidate division KSB3 bacterium]
MKQILRVEHWIIRKFRFERMSNNLFWLAALLLPFVIALMLWLFRLHDQPGVEFIVNRDPSFSGKVAEIYFQNEQFYFRPLTKNLLVNFRPVTETSIIQENDQIVIGHTIFQVRQLNGWTPHLRTIGYYATDRALKGGVSVGRSIHSEELNNWETNDIIVKDSTFEPVHFMLFSEGEERFRIKNVGQKGVFVPYVPAEGETSIADMPNWTHVSEEALISAGQRMKIENCILELIRVKEQEALAFNIIRGVRPTYPLSRQATNIIGGLRMIPKHYIPNYLVDEEFIEYVRQAIEHGLFFLDDPDSRQDHPKLFVKGFDRAGKLLKDEFRNLSPKQTYLLHKIFRFREQEGTALRWRRPFNREAKDSYAFYPSQTENFVLDLQNNAVKNIYRYAAHLTNPHSIAEEVATIRGEIYDRDQYSHARLVAYRKSETTPRAELLLIPSPNPATVLPFKTQEELDSIVYIAGGYRFSNNLKVIYEGDSFYLVSGQEQHPLTDGQHFDAGKYTFRYVAPGKGLLAENRQDEKQRITRYYPLGSRLAHIVGYSFTRSQFKGNIEKVFDRVLLGQEKKKPWWALEKTTERTPGNNLILTLDDDLEKVVFAELQKKLQELNRRYHTDTFRGAAIMLNKEGAILASATQPSYDPNSLSSILQALEESSDDHWNSSYINRATHKSYPPGSTMKVIMSSIALDNKEQFLWDMGDGQYLIKDGQKAFFCTGHLTSFRGVSFGKYDIPDFGGASHGQLTLDRALTKSCNNTFAFIALTAGWEMIQSYAERYGFNQQFDFLPYDMFKDDIQLVSSVKRGVRDPLASLKSRVPTPKQTLKLPQLARMGIGQWEILATPLQMATVAMTVGNLGLRPYPHIVAGIEDFADRTIRTFPYPKKKRVFSDHVLAELFPMMQHVVQMGSAVRLSRSTIPYYSLKDHVAGKTGTAEVEDQNGKKSNVVWFISFAPVEDPQLALAVVIEKGPIISGEAVEVARGIWEKTVLLYPELFGLSSLTQQKNRQ